MTIGMWITFGVAVFIGIIATIWAGYYAYEEGNSVLSAVVIAFLISAIVCGGILIGGHWYYGNTASGARALKDQQSELSNGLMREIVITAEDGRQIFYYKGKCDIETDHANYILFEDENGCRHIIYKGVQDTIIVNELPNK